jgi:hypothetical protein
MAQDVRVESIPSRSQVRESDCGPSVIVPEMDEVAAELDFIVGIAECNLSRETFFKVPDGETITSAKHDVGVDFLFSGRNSVKLGDYIPKTASGYYSGSCILP